MKKEIKITYSQHAIKQMKLPTREITKHTIESIIKNNKNYILTNKNTRRIYLDRNNDPNNWIKIITNNSNKSKNMHVITAIRNDPLDFNFSFTALDFLKKNNINNTEILDSIKYAPYKVFENDKLIIKNHKYSIITCKNKIKILSIRNI
tara:strand:+ start:11829 stop:12275 length:447 start_codon:yes stop_codon:yes gene_type:complete